MDTSATGSSATPVRDLDAALGRLVARGTLSESQADLVRAELQASQGTEQPRPAQPDEASKARSLPSIGPVVEAAGYAGGVLAAAAGLALGTQVWGRLESWAQVAVLALAAAVLWVAGRVIADEPRTADSEPGGTFETGAVSRLTGTLWLASTAATAAASGVAAGGLLGVSAETIALLVGLATLVQGLLLWRARPGALQLLAPYAGALITLFAALEHLPRPPHDLYALLGWAVGAAGLALAWGGLLHPRRAAHALGGLVALASAQLLAFDLGIGDGSGGLVLGLATAIGLLALARVVDHPVLTGLGAAGLAVFVPQLLGELFPGSLAAPAAVFLGGVGLLAAAIVAIRSGRDDSGPTAGTDHG